MGGLPTRAVAVFNLRLFPPLKKKNKIKYLIFFIFFLEKVSFAYWPSKITFDPMVFNTLSYQSFNKFVSLVSKIKQQENNF